VVQTLRPSSIRVHVIAAERRYELPIPCVDASVEPVERGSRHVSTWIEDKRTTLDPEKPYRYTVIVMVAMCRSDGIHRVNTAFGNSHRVLRGALSVGCRLVSRVASRRKSRCVTRAEDVSRVCSLSREPRQLTDLTTVHSRHETRRPSYSSTVRFVTCGIIYRTVKELPSHYTR
jgi:hypothetical protein